MLKLDEPFRNQEIFKISFFNSSDLDLVKIIFFLQFLVYFAPWIRIFFADPGPESQNLADPTDPDPKHR